MYFDQEWYELTDHDLSALLGNINPIDGKYPVAVDKTDVSLRNLSFYEKVELIRVKDPTWEPDNLFVYYLRDRGHLFRLNGTSPPLHEVNARAPIKINEQNCIAYLEFFCFFVRGDDGPFLVAQSMEDTYVPKQLDAAARTVLEATVRRATFEGIDVHGNYLVDAVLYYSNAIFIANFKVMPDGKVEMTNDEPIAGDLPFKIDAPLA